MKEQVCSKCRKTIPLDRFGKYTDPRNGCKRIRKTCNACRRSDQALRYRMNPEVKAKMKRTAKKWRLGSTYGITEEQYAYMLEAQNYNCGACGVKPKYLCVDHDHVTGKVRGLLCKQCNFGIGYFHDSIEKLKGAIAYLERTAS